MSTSFSKLNKLITNLQTRQTQVVAGNKAFKKLSKKQQRITIAKDALKQLNARVYKASPGDWCNTHLPATYNPELKSLEEWADPDEASSQIKAKLNEIHQKHSNVLQPLLLEPGVTCEVCALGALFASTVRKADGCDVNPLKYIAEYGEGSHDADHDNISITLSDYFSAAQQRLMELAFERGYGATSVDSKQDLQAARMYPSTYTATQRLRGILNNIIKNDGTFVIDTRRNVDEEWEADYVW